MRRTGWNTRCALTAAALLTATTVLAGCGTGSAGDSAGVTLTVVATNYGDDEVRNSESYWNAVDTAFEATHPGIRIDVKVYEPGEAETRVAALVKGGRSPDLAQIGSYADYASAGLLYSAADLLSIKTQANFLPNLADAGTTDNALYGLPFLASTRLLYINKKLFGDAGLDAPTTWQELRDDAQVLKERGVKYPYALPLGPEEAQAETLQWLLGGGGGYTDDSGGYAIDSARNIATFTWLRDDLVGAGLTGPVAPAKLDRKAALQAFVDGDAGMVSAPAALTRQIARSVDPVDYEAVPMPGRTAGRAAPTVGTTDWIAAFKRRGHAEQIGTFLDFLYRDKYVTDLAGTYQLLPVTASASDAMRADTTYRGLWSGLDTLTDAQLYPIGKASWASVSTEIQRTIGGAVASGGSPASVLGAIQRRAAAAEKASG